MRIVCPTCAAAYDVPDSLLTAGRVVRCARCSGEWLPDLSPPPETEELPTQNGPASSAEALATAMDTPVPAAYRPGVRLTAQPGPTAMDRLAANPAVPPPRYGLRVAWAASVVLLLLLACGAYTWRSDIVRAWPSSVRMYAAFGLHTDTNQTQ